MTVNRDQNKPISDEQMLDCLNRSGYMMESRIISELEAAGFWILPNQSIKDDLTGKDREIDIICEHPQWFEENKHDVISKLYLNSTFVIEAINRAMPIVLMTQKPWHPDVSYFSGLKFWKTGDFIDEMILRENILSKFSFERVNAYLQYCSFEEKKSGRGSSDGEFMATHPTDLHSSFLKIQHFVDGMVDRNNESANDNCLRLLFWHPIYCVSAPICVLSGDGKLKHVEHAIYEYKYYTPDALGQDSMMIHFVRESFLLSFLKSILDNDKKMRNYIIKKIGDSLTNQRNLHADA